MWKRIICRWKKELLLVYIDTYLTFSPTCSLWWYNTLLFKLWKGTNLAERKFENSQGTFCLTLFAISPKWYRFLAGVRALQFDFKHMWICLARTGFWWPSVELGIFLALALVGVKNKEWRKKCKILGIVLWKCKEETNIKLISKVIETADDCYLL